MSLQEYNKKRNFKKTSEPRGAPKKSSTKNPIFVVQEHWASHHHFDFRLEAFGTLKSWAVPKGVSTTVGDKRLAVEVEDHPIPYAKFKGDIPEGEYGAGHVEIWDKGVWEPPPQLKDDFKKGHIEFSLSGKKLKGRWLLQRTNQQGKKNLWLLIKKHEEKIKPVLKKFKKTNISLIDTEPQLATLVDKVPQGEQWLYEIKLDGYRTLTKVYGKKVQMLTRNGLDWTKKYQPLDEQFRKLKIESAVFDGELVALDKKGHSHFSELQSALKSQKADQLYYYLFDLLYLNGQDLRDQPLETRKQLLKKILAESKSKNLRFSDHFRTSGEELFKEACKQGLEGIIAKDRHESYHRGRSDIWQKVKCSNRQEFIIGGYTEPQNARLAFGALLMGTYQDGQLRYVGRVGTGFNDRTLSDTLIKLKRLKNKSSPFEIASPKDSKKIHWVKPQLVAEVEFKAWTSDQILRHASFQGLRQDKSAKEVHIETPQKNKNAELKSKSKNKFKITHPDRVLYPEQKITKMDVARYYKSISPWMLPHIQERPLSLLRCTDQVGGQCFFQKHFNIDKMDAVYETTLKDQNVNYLDSEEGLLQLVQWGTLEFHTWQTHQKNGLHPDQIVFDFDPDESLAFSKVIDGVRTLKKLLDKLNLKSFVKTTGGKGLHVHVPISPIYTWEQIKDFSKVIAQEMEAQEPKLYISTMSKDKRKGKIFLDYLRNGFGSSAIAPYSLRARQNPTVAMPISWKEFETLKNPQIYDIDSALKKMAHSKSEPWPKYFSLKQKISILKSR